MTKGEDFVRRLPADGTKSRENGARDGQEAAAFFALLRTQSKTFVPPRSLDSSALAEGIASLSAAPPLARAAVVSRPVPLVFYELPRALRAADFDPSKAIFMYWGWDMAFGGSLTITASYVHLGTFGRAYLSNANPALLDFRAGRFVCVCVKNGAPAIALDVDLCNSDDARSAFDENWSRAKEYPALATDEDALFWQSLRGTGGGHELKPRDRVSFGWSERYAEAVAKLHGHLEVFKREFAWPRDAQLPPRFADWGELLARAPHIDADGALALARARHAAGFEKLMDLCLVQNDTSWHDAVHAVMGDHTPLCDITTMTLEAHLLSSAQTLCGRRVPLLRNGKLEYHAIDPDDFSSEVAKQYWQRVTRLPVEWTSLAKPDDVPADMTPGSTTIAVMPRAEDPKAAISAGEALLDEALAEKKWTIPHGALLELSFGPFTHLELRESDAEVEFLLRNEAGEFTSGGIHLSKGDRRLWWEALTSDEKEMEARSPIASGLYLMLSAVIRDFLVVEERERVFRHGTAPSRLQRGGAEDGPRVVYLPRVNYVGRADIERCRQELDQGSREPRQHAVRPHLRRAEAPSPTQLFLARRYGIEVPTGYTFVRPHERGRKARDVIYRSRSALECLFEVAGPTGTAGGAREAWFQFERDVHRLMVHLGFAVEHVAASRRGDRGVDVYATKGSDLESVAWVIQCKAFAPRHKVGPNIVRELVGTLAEYPAGTRGMIVTTSDFTRETAALAKRHNVRLMDGKEFGRLLQAAHASSPRAS